MASRPKFYLPCLVRYRRWLWSVIGIFATTATIASISGPPAAFVQETTWLTVPASTGMRQAPAPISEINSDSLPGRWLLLRPSILERHLTALGQQATALVPRERAVTMNPYELRVARIYGVIQTSLMDDGAALGLSEKLRGDLAAIFGWDIDLMADLQPGDQFSLIYEEKYWRGRKLADGNILAAQIIHRGRIYRVVGFGLATDQLDYFTPDGLSVRRLFLRSPVPFGRISSQFSSSRYHPVLKERRAHQGVDYVAPIGTPIRATAAGMVISISRHPEYGNTIVIQHDTRYSTLYAHLARFRQGLRAGQTVAQGETIGYVGQSGLATGPHLHYELRVEGIHQDPLAFVVADGERKTLPAYLRATFFQLSAIWSTYLGLGTDAQLAHNNQQGKT